MIGSHANTTHLDEGSLEWAQLHFGIRTMVDFGCGPGGQVALARKLNIKAFGVDGDTNLTAPHLFHWDFREGSWDNPYHYRIDLGWSNEMAEHLEERYLSNLMRSFTQCAFFIFAAARPPNAPPSHVNCREPAYWIDKFTSYGFYHSLPLTVALRAASTMEREFIRDHGLFFINQELYPINS